MSEGSARRGRPTAGPLLLAVIFLAVLGAGAGFSLGTLAKGAQTPPSTSATSPPAPAGSGTPDNGGQQNNPGNTTSSTGSGNTGGDTNSTQCPKHTVDLANDGPLSLALYLRTAQSEVWICKAADGTLFYQGHSGSPGGQLREHINALYLTDITTEGSNGYVATNTDTNGHQTKYHVTPDKLVKEYIGFSSPKPNETEPAV
jgi:hypothetical protein